MKIFNWTFCAIFVLFGVLQYNDPDPLVWMAFYFYAAFLCMLSARGRYQAKLFLIGCAVYVPYALFLFFHKEGALHWLVVSEDSLVQSMKAENPWIESGREFFGLVIVLAVLTINYVKQKRAKSLGQVKLTAV